jgi:SWI/SNF-related matrix-associated actin-dependent regulator of chromatin subfamily A-like protein 1
MEIRTTPHYFELIFPYRPSIVEAVKALPGRKFNPGTKTWRVPTSYRREVEVFAHRYGFTFSSVTNKVVNEDYTIPALPELTLDIPLQMTLREYQRGGVAYNLLHKRVIIGDDMGLGKTGQAIASIVGGDIIYQQTGENPVYPCLVICPSSVKYNWQDQWQKWTGRNITMILNDSVKRNWWLYYEANMTKVFIVNYESLKKYFVNSIEKGDAKHLRLNHIKFNENIQRFNSIIIDECHRVKDTKTLQTKFTKGISIGKKWVFGLTGTPVVNKPKDLISQLGILDVMGYFGGYKGFTDDYCQGEREASNLKKLNYMLNKYCFYRRSKQEVAKELPPKSRQVVLCDITNRKEYEAAQNDLINYLTQYKDATDEKIQSALRGEVMVKIGILKNISARGKMADVLEYIDDVVEDGEKLGIFVHLKEIGYELLKHYKNSAVITGDIDLKERQNQIRKFKEDPKCTTAILSIMAAGTGVDGLQHAASTACFIEQPWTAAACDQAEDRFNRIGQTKPVTIIYFLGRDTIDQHIYSIIQQKRDIADAITGNTDEVKIDFVNEFANLLTKK